MIRCRNHITGTSPNSLPHPTRTWQEEFELTKDRFTIWDAEQDSLVLNDTRLKAFISALLSRQESELREKIEGMKQECPNHAEDSNVECYGYVEQNNQTLDDVLKLLHT